MRQNAVIRRVLRVRPGLAARHLTTRRRVVVVHEEGREVRRPVRHVQLEVVVRVVALVLRGAVAVRLVD